KAEAVDVVPAAAVAAPPMVEQPLEPVRAATESTAPAKHPHRQTPWLPGQPVLSKAKDEAVDVVPAAAVAAPPMVEQPLEPVRAATESTAPAKHPHRQTPWLPGQHAPVPSKAKDEAVDVVPAAAVAAPPMVEQSLEPVRAATESTAPAKHPHRQTPWLPGQHAPVLSKTKDEAVDVVPAAAVAAPPMVEQPVEPVRAATESTAPAKHPHRQTPWLPGQPVLSKAKDEAVDVVPAAAVAAPPMVEQSLEPVRAATESTAPAKHPHRQTPWLPGQHAPVLSKAKAEAVDVVPAAAVAAPPMVEQSLEPVRAATESTAPAKHPHRQTPWLPGQHAPVLSKAEAVDVVPAAAVAAPPMVEQ
ncbi:hypothetical protein PF010_g31235, partial [Phytophthora fragariae]